jgi:hypothetical protein
MLLFVKSFGEDITMSQMIERLKEGLADAQKRHGEVTKRFQAAQAEWQASNAEVLGYQKVIELETRRDLEKAAIAPQMEGPVTQAEQQAGQDVNKTQLVKDALADHPGLTPAQLYGALKNQIGRPYVYSVLKRLKDKKQVCEKRGKYYLPPTPKLEEGHEQTSLQ